MYTFYILVTIVSALIRTLKCFSATLPFSVSTTFILGRLVGWAGAKEKRKILAAHTEVNLKTEFVFS